MGGVVRNVIPGFRISDEAIDNDVKIVAAMGVEMVNGKEITSIDELKKEYDYIVLAVGASDKGTLKLEAGDTMNALDFLAQFKATDGKLDLGKNVVVIGGGIPQGQPRGTRALRRFPWYTEGPDASCLPTRKNW